MKNKYELNQLEIPKQIVERDGPFKEFKQDTSFVTIVLNDGKQINGVVLLYPNYIIAIEGKKKLFFNPGNVTKVVQTQEDLHKRTSSDWTFFYDPENFTKN